MQHQQTPWQHRTVLLREAVDALWDEADGPLPRGRYVDATFGRGGHSRLILSKLGPDAALLSIDRDPEAIAHATQGEAAIHDPRFHIAHAPFSQWAEAAEAQGWDAVDGLLMDIGVSSPQIDNPERGFSFRFDAPLDMRMDTTSGESAADFLARASLDELADVIRTYGEERFAGPIARAIVARRDEGHPIRTTAELSAVVARAVKTREPGQDPATRTFQALRIHVNRELGELEDALDAALRMLAPGGRLAVISFHSLEDRIVKTFIARHSKEEVDRRVPFAQPRPLLLKSIGRIKPSDEEVAGNPRSRSAVLRVAERTGTPWSPELVAAASPREAGKVGKSIKPAKPTKPTKAPRGAGKGAPMMLRLNILLAVVLLGSCVWLIRSSHESRRLVYELEKSKSAARELQIEFERLELDKRAQATPLRVERLAREKLRMFGNNPGVTHYVSASSGVASGAVGAAPVETASGGRP